MPFSLCTLIIHVTGHFYTFSANCLCSHLTVHGQAGLEMGSLLMGMRVVPTNKLKSLCIHSNLLSRNISSCICK